MQRLRNRSPDFVEPAADGRMQPVPCLPEYDGGFRLAVQQARCPYEMPGDGSIACDGVELLVQHAGEGEQIVALVLQGHAHRADA